VADEDRYEDFWNWIRPKRGVPVQRTEPEPKEGEVRRVSRLESVVVDQDGVPLISPERAIMSREVHQWVQAITARVLNNYIGRVTDDTLPMILSEVGRTLAMGGEAAFSRLEVASTPESTQEGLGTLLTHAGVSEASYSQDFRSDDRTLTLRFIPTLGSAPPRVRSSIDGAGNPVVYITFDLRSLTRPV